MKCAVRPLCSSHSPTCGKLMRHLILAMKQFNNKDVLNTVCSLTLTANQLTNVSLVHLYTCILKSVFCPSFFKKNAMCKQCFKTCRKTIEAVLRPVSRFLPHLHVHLGLVEQTAKCGSLLWDGWRMKQ